MTTPHRSLSGDATAKYFWWGLLAVCLALLYYIRFIITPFLWGAVFAYLLSPLSKKMVQKGFSSTLASLMVLLPFVSLMVGVFFLFIPILQREVITLIRDVPGYLVALQAALRDLVDHVHVPALSHSLLTMEHDWAQHMPDAMNMIGSAFSGLFNSTLIILNFLTTLIVMPIISYYLLTDWHKVTLFVQEILPKKRASKLRAVLQDIDTRISGFIRGQLIISLVFAIFYGGGLWALDLKHGLLLGALTGFFSFIPVISYVIGGAIAVILAAYQFQDFWPLLWIIVLFAGGGLLENIFLVPKLVGNKVGLNPAWVLFFLFVGSTFFGFFGLMFAIPIGAIVASLTQYLLREYKESRYYLR